MRDTESDLTKQPGQRERTTSDNLCKLLVELYPEQFARWLFGPQVGRVKLLKTELSREPIRADSVILLAESDDIFHIEFQTTIRSTVPVPLRMLDYYVGFKRQNMSRRVRQVLIVLKYTGEEIPDRYVDELTYHVYRVIKIWEIDPDELLEHEGLLPMATLCRAESGEELLEKVAARISKIESSERRREAISLSRVVAGLRYDKEMIYRILKEGDMLEESVVYQDILQKGVQQGLQQGLQQGVQQGREQGEKSLVLRQLERLLGKLPATTREQIEGLGLEQLEALGEALIEFKSEHDLTNWLKQNISAQ